MISIVELPDVREQVKYATDYIFGGYENSIADGVMSIAELPSCELLIEEILENLRYCSYGPGFEASGSTFDIQPCDYVLLRGMIAHELIYGGEFR